MGERSHEQSTIEFVRLTVVLPQLLMEHMNDPRIRRHLPLLQSIWTMDDVDAFVAAKEAHWNEHGLGHWAIHVDGRYAGWGGLQREGPDWDLGLVLHPHFFGAGHQVVDAMLRWARRNTNIDRLSFLLPPSRSRRALVRMGAQSTGEAMCAGQPFVKWILELAEWRAGP